MRVKRGVPERRVRVASRPREAAVVILAVFPAPGARQVAKRQAKVVSRRRVGLPAVPVRHRAVVEQ